MKFNIKKTVASILLSSMLFSTACSTVPEDAPALMSFKNTDVQSVITMIDSITEASFETEDAIEAACVAYYELDSIERKQVTNFDKLLTLRDEIADLYEDTTKQGDRVDRSKILMGTYGIGHTDDEHIRWLSECGIDFIVGAPSSLLDSLNKYNIGAFTPLGYYGIPSWSGGGRNIDQDPPEPTFDKEYFASQLPELSVIDHEALWGLDIVDEPDSRSFWFHEDQRAALTEKYPNYFTYINLFCELGGPISAVSGSRTYQEYIDTYVETVNTDFICYDCYMYRYTAGKIDPCLDDIVRCTSVIANACRDTSRDFWMWLQISFPDSKEHSLSLDMIRYETNLVLAFGVTSIIWSVWETGWWENRVLDENGNKTERYDFLKTVIDETEVLSPVLMKYKSVDNAIIGFKHPEIQDFYKMNDNVMDQDVFVDLKAVDRTQDSILCGYFEKKIGEGSAMMFVNITDPACETRGTAVAWFKVSDEEATVTLHDKNGSYIMIPDADGYYCIEVENAEYAFVTVE